MLSFVCRLTPSWLWPRLPSRGGSRGLPLPSLPGARLQGYVPAGPVPRCPTFAGTPQADPCALPPHPQNAAPARQPPNPQTQRQVDCIDWGHRQLRTARRTLGCHASSATFLASTTSSRRLRSSFRAQSRCCKKKESCAGGKTVEVSFVTFLLCP